MKHSHWGLMWFILMSSFNYCFCRQHHNMKKTHLKFTNKHTSKHKHTHSSSACVSVLISTASHLKDKHFCRISNESSLVTVSITTLNHQPAAALWSHKFICNHSESIHVIRIWSSSWSPALITCCQHAQCENLTDTHVHQRQTLEERFLFSY